MGNLKDIAKAQAEIANWPADKKAAYMVAMVADYAMTAKKCRNPEGWKIKLFVLIQNWFD